MSEKPSKFAAFLKTRKTESEAEIPAEETKAPRKATAPPPEPRKRGRPGGHGKRLNPQYTQVTAYIPEALHTETKINLLRSGKGEFSGLVEELLTGWNRSQGRG